MKTSISEETSISGLYNGNWEDLYNSFNEVNPSYNDTEKLTRLSKLYIKFGKIFAIRADIAWAQMCYETNYLEYKGSARPEWNNFAGIGVTGKPGIGNIFANEELGVIAHHAHLAWYIFPDHLNEYCNKNYDPRHFGRKHNFTGNFKLDRLNGAWSPDKNYVKNLIKIVKKINNLGIPQIDEFDLIIQMGHIGRIKGYIGTVGEQAFTRALGTSLFKKFQNSEHKVRLMGADNFYLPEPNKTRLFFSIHADGNQNRDMRGISIGYPIPSNPAFAQAIKEEYIKLTGFGAKKDNYTKGLERYYAWRRDDREIPHITADYYCLLEHGFMTNQIERDFVNNHTGEIADCHYSTIVKFLKNIN
jgi:hypothetical protein